MTTQQDQEVRKWKVRAVWTYWLGVAGYVTCLCFAPVPLLMLTMWIAATFGLCCLGLAEKVYGN